MANEVSIFCSPLFVAIAASLSLQSAAAAGGGAAEFVRSLGDQALRVIRADAAPTPKLAFFHEMLDRDFAMRQISRFVLGPYWRSATPAEREQFVQLLSDDIVRFYNRRFAEYRGETLQVTGSRTDPAGVIVTSQIVRPDGPPIPVDWRLIVDGGVYKISDVIIAGVSMALSERAEFAQQIQRSGGQVAGLLARMREQAQGPGSRAASYAATALPVR